jgi:hypothetical protein
MSTNSSQIIQENMSCYRFHTSATFSIKIRDSNLNLLYYSSINEHGFREISICDNPGLIIRKNEGKFGSHFITLLEFTNSDAVKNSWFRKTILEMIQKLKDFPEHFEGKLDKQVDKLV